jgi:hypothetical protein
LADITNFNNWQEFDISKLERGKEYLFYLPNSPNEFIHYYLGRVEDFSGDIEFDVLDYSIRYCEIRGTKFSPSHYIELIKP